MIQRLSHCSIFVFDQDVAYDFYVNKLGFEQKMDLDMGEWRWLTVSPKGQPDLELVLIPVKPSQAGPFKDQATCDSARQLVAHGQMPTGSFITADCRKTYEELLAKGVEFASPPKEQFYGIECAFKDPFGNKFSLTQPKPVPARQ